MYYCVMVYISPNKETKDLNIMFKRYVKWFILETLGILQSFLTVCIDIGIEGKGRGK